MATELPSGKQIEGFQGDFDRLRREIGKAVVGHEGVIENILIAAIAGGHVLLEGVPGIGKTLLVKTLAQVLRLTFQRIQFTPDLMPSDLIGTYVVMETPQGRRTFEFQKGPLFAQLILADQINRGTPKAQSALLEAMEGQSISVSTETFELPSPFLVMATQNPLEMEGTFPLPEPQLDRFLVKLIVAPPSEGQIEQILDRTTGDQAPVVAAIADQRRIIEMRQIARRVSIGPDVRRLAVALVAASHPGHARSPARVKQCVRYGSSARGAQAMVLGAKVRAAASGRDAVSPSDLRAVAHAALRHRLILNFEGQAEDVPTDLLVDDLVETILGSASKTAEPKA